MKKINGPTCLIAKTIKGKGLKMMENKPQWHYWNDISVSEYNKSINELKNK